MIYIQPLRKNDINPSMGKQYEFGKAFFSSFGWEGGTTHEIKVNYKARTIKTSVKVRGDERGGERVGADGKEYAIDGKLPLKDLLINGLCLNESHVGVVTLIFEALNEEGTDFNLYTVPERIPSSLPALDLNDELKNEPLQQIYYGAPGTGKSFSIDALTKKQTKENVFRTTFHPDSDYSSFVGCYKPCKNEAGEITYDFRAQAFVDAYVQAYLKPTEPVFLLIEEINRGNCAQIFGDIFQLLDRDDETGFSKYSITPDKDLQDYLCECFASQTYLDDDIKEGKSMRLPNNLYIWATMNTSDQSLFPIDSAFKRRWDWVYVPIDTKKETWSIKVNGLSYSWSSFLQKINDLIWSTTTSEDKKLGFYFCKAENGIISADKFVSKVLFFLYNDVFKTYGFDNADCFKHDDKNIEFHEFYLGFKKVNEALVAGLLDKLGVEKVETEDNGNLKVTFEDGTIIQEPRSVDTFVKAIEKIGADKVATLEIEHDGLPLISTDAPEGHSYRNVGDWKLQTTLRESRKKDVLKEISDKLSLNLIVESK